MPDRLISLQSANGLKGCLRSRMEEPHHVHCLRDPRYLSMGCCQSLQPCPLSNSCARWWGGWGRLKGQGARAGGCRLRLGTRLLRRASRWTRCAFLPSYVTWPHTQTARRAEPVQRRAFIVARCSRSLRCILKPWHSQGYAHLVFEIFFDCQGEEEMLEGGGEVTDVNAAEFAVYLFTLSTYKSVPPPAVYVSIGSDLGHCSTQLSFPLRRLFSRT